MNRVLQLTAPNKLDLVDKEMPAPPESGIVLKTHCAGICHTDVHCWKDDFGGVSLTEFLPELAFPLVLGHEISGEVYSLGDGYKGDLHVGDRVVLYPWVGCSTCPMCQHGYNRECEKMFGESYGVGKYGGYQAYIACQDPQFAVKVPDGVDMAVASLTGCGALTAYGSLRDVQGVIEMYAKCTGSANLLIAGAGGLGLWCVAIARAIFPETTNIFVSDISEDKFAAAEEIGATKGILWGRKDSSDELIKKTTEAVGGKVHAFIDLVASSATIAASIGFLAHSGKVEVIGSLSPSAPLDVVTIVDAMLTVKGHITGSVKQTAELLSLINEGKMKLPPMTRVRLEDAEDCLVKLQQGKVTGRQIIDFSMQ